MTGYSSAGSGERLEKHRLLRSKAQVQRTYSCRKRMDRAGVKPNVFEIPGAIGRIETGASAAELNALQMDQVGKTTNGHSRSKIS